MNNSLLEKITVERSLIYVLIGGVLIVFIFIFYLFFSYGSKSIEILSPNGGEEWEIGKSYEIKWRAKGLEKVGIVFFKGLEPEWIAKDVKANLGKYQWKIYPGQEYGSDYWIAVFEYPWQKGNEIDYTAGAFAVTFSELAGCEGLSIENEWPYLPSDFPSLREVFITPESYSGNLGGLEGADEKCQQSAEAQGLNGNWQAFLGGDSDQESALERLKQSSRKTNGIFVSALPTGDPLIRGASCHRLLGRDFEEFLDKFSALLIVNQEKLESGFLESMVNLWLGRFDARSRKNCLPITDTLADSYGLLAEKYSFTVTCQNWTRADKLVQGYPVPRGEPKPLFPVCYTPEGKSTDAVALAGLASGSFGLGTDALYSTSIGEYCNEAKHLLCIEK